MSCIDEQDLELVEAYLDGALTPEEAVSFASRVARESALAAGLEQARAEREVRRAVWSSYEADVTRADWLAASSVAAAVRNERFGRAARLARQVTAAAAVIVLAFAGGWLARGRSAPHAATAVRPASTNEHAFISSGAGGGESFPLSLGVAVRRVDLHPPGQDGSMVRVDQVVPGSAADRAGVLAGDFVLSLAGKNVTDVSALSAALATRNGPTEVRLLRAGEVIDVTIDHRQE